jgi:hypothetical protein
MVPQQDPDSLHCILPAAARGMGTFIAAPPGSGKSRLIGRRLAWRDFINKIPLVVKDPTGGATDNFLDKIRREPSRKKQEEYWKRVRYVPMNGYQGHVVPWPIYYEAWEGESFSSQAQRFVEVITRVDPNLQTAPMQGLNALSGAAHPGGIVLRALGLGISQLWDLLRNPTAWEAQLERVEREHPETVEAIDDLRMLATMIPRDRFSQLMSLRNKLRPLRLNPTYKAIFGGTTPGIDWQEVVDKKLAVLIDFRGVQDEMKRFCLLWVYNSFLTYIKHRGHGNMDNPISFIIDELSFMVDSAGGNADILTADLNELKNQIARSHGVWVTLATQGLFQLPPRMQQTMLSMGTVILGQMSDDRMAEELARRFYQYDPFRLKKSRRIYGTESRGSGIYRASRPVVVGEQTTEYTRGEQTVLNSRIFLALEQYHFLVGQSKREGELPTALHEVSIEDLDRGQFQENVTTDPIRALLARRDGLPINKLLKEITPSPDKPVPLPAQEDLKPLRPRARKPPKPTPPSASES